MRDIDVGREIRAHFQAEVDRARASVRGARDRGGDARAPVSRARRAAGWLAAAAAILLAPVLMFVGRPTAEPLAVAIQTKWDQSGRNAVMRALAEAGRILDPVGENEEVEE